jgi:hypothetical protein
MNFSRVASRWAGLPSCAADADALDGPTGSAILGLARASFVARLNYDCDGHAWPGRARTLRVCHQPPVRRRGATKSPTLGR